MRIISIALLAGGLALTTGGHAHVGGAIAAGSNHTCALSPTNQVYCWGDDTVGELGSGRSLDGTTPTSHPLPSLVVSPSGNGPLLMIAEVSAGRRLTCARNGFTSQLLCWGSNRAGQFGNGEESVVSSVPKFVLNPATLAPVDDGSVISAGDGFSCAVFSVPFFGSGLAACSGSNGNWVFGNNSSIGSTLPIPILDPPGVKQIAVKENRVCALSFDTSVFCWGSSTNLGDGSIDGSAVPVAVRSPTGTDFLNDVVSVDVSLNATCAILDTGTVFCWGTSPSGETGNGSAGASLPSQVLDKNGKPLLNVSQISGGENHFCGLKTDSSVVCWGYNGDGELGDNNSPTNSGVPSQVVDASGASFMDVIAISAGDSHNCAMKRNASIWCWGSNSSGQLGNGTFKNSSVPVRVDFDTIFRDAFQSN